MKPIFFRYSSLVFFAGLLVLVSTIFISCQPQWVEPSHHEGIKPTPTGPWLPSGKIDLFTLGRVLFYDKNLSQDKSVSCGSCHQQAHGFADNKAFSIGYGGLQTTRNAHSILNTNNYHFWDGRINNYLNAIAVPLQTHSELNMTDLDSLCKRLAAIYYYPDLFKQASPYSTTDISPATVELAISTFITSINASNSKYDQAYPSTQSGHSATATLSPQELNGMAIFNGKGKCSLCHSPTNDFGGKPGQFEDIGLDLVYNDLGRGAITNNGGDNGRFQVPALKNISLTAPYMHDGRFKTLSEVVDFFSNNINSSANLSSALTAHPIPDGNGGYLTGGTAVPVGLTATEKSDLVAFLLTLTDMSQINDVNYSDPFKH
ncbi:MAG: cytochrome-c peroxidase [Bacteroidia bacterium]